MYLLDYMYGHVSPLTSIAITSYFNKILVEQNCILLIWKSGVLSK